MTVSINIHAENATDALEQLVVLAAALTGKVGAPAPKTTEAYVARVAEAAVPGSEEVVTVADMAERADDGTVDAHGWPWSPDLHASTKGVTKDGLWRMKVGVTRPDPKPGFPIGNTGTVSNGEESSVPATAPTETASPVEDDEFAAFREAAAKADANDAAAKATVPARKWTDADLGALCNQAALKMGDPGPVKEIIATFVPAGEVSHSRNIPAEKREEFAKAVEAKVGIEFAG
jgi:hypothetical protein